MIVGVHYYYGITYSTMFDSTHYSRIIFHGPHYYVGINLRSLAKAQVSSPLGADPP